MLCTYVTNYYNVLDGLFDRTIRHILHNNRTTKNLKNCFKLTKDHTSKLFRFKQHSKLFHGPNTPYGVYKLLLFKLTAP